MANKEVPQIIIDLVEKFDREKEKYTNPQVHDEENNKIEFINPFFEALGWDVHNKTGKPLSLKEVVFEKSVKKGRRTKKPDYAFRIDEENIFFVEAKKPSVNIDTNRDTALQIRSYGWTAGLPLCILTDFEEFAVYETITRPDKNQHPKISRVKYYKYTDYIEKWDEIANIFSKEAVCSGKFDEYVKTIKPKDTKGTSTVDKEFLKEIEKWRELLAKNIVKNNNLLIGDLNYAVQLIIDRIIFFRMAEDRGIERYGRLYDLLDEENIYKSFTELCRKADDKYNSGLFHFYEKDGKDTLDTFTLDLKIENKVFKKIFKNLYYPNSPYAFGVLPAEILGNIYEKFLGNIIRKTSEDRVKIEEKPEVQKAGGVYYTPHYIVKYIVKNTVGELIKEKKPDEISNIKIIDPACGSGSFLLEAYQQLLDYHLDYYVTHLDKYSERNIQKLIHKGRDGEWRLRIQEKKRILLNNIFGVDIDSNAVEVTKLSLLLKVLEDERIDTDEQQQKLFQERVLPNLGKNIMNGNSVIDNKFWNEHEYTLDLDKEFKPFIWEKRFPEIFENGGFDAVIGNPPYVNVENIEEITKNYYSKYYDTFMKRADLFTVFMDLGLNRLTKKYLGFIVPSIIFTNVSYKKLRNLILDDNYLDRVCYTGQNVFEEVIVDTTILIVSKEKKDNLSLINALDFKNKKSFNVDYDYFKEFDNVISLDDEETIKIVNKLFDGDFTTLKDNFSIFQGIVTGKNPAFIFQSKEEAFKQNIEEDLLKSVCFGKDINQWEIENHDNKIMYIDSNYNINEYPFAKKWLSIFKKDLKNRRECKNKTIKWYSLQWPRKKEELDRNEKILVQAVRNERLKRRVVAAIDDSGIYSTQGLFNIIPKNDDYSLYFLTCLLNSNAINYIFATKFLNLGIKKDYLNKIEFPKLSLEEQEPFIKLAKERIQLGKQIKIYQNPNDQVRISERINDIENEINKLVYELYDFTDEEISIVENILK